MELRSGSISGAKNEGNEENITDVNKLIIEDIWLEIEKRVSMFFIEEKISRKELLEELEITREENIKLREEMSECKLLISTHIGNISEKDRSVTKGNAVANENDCVLSAKDKIEAQLIDVRNALKSKFYNERPPIVKQPKQLEPLPQDIIPPQMKHNVLSIPTTTIQDESPPTPPKDMPTIPTDLKSSSTFQWPHGTTLIVGDSMLGGIEETRMGPRRKVRSFPGATIADLREYIVPLLRKKPSRLIAHIGTNDASFSSAKKIADDLLLFQKFVQSQLPDCLVIISSPINRLDDQKKAVTIRNVNVILKNMTDINLVDNSNITVKHLGKRKLHLNLSGSSMLARNFLEKMKSL